MRVFSKIPLAYLKMYGIAAMHATQRRSGTGGVHSTTVLAATLYTSASTCRTYCICCYFPTREITSCSCVKHAVETGVCKQWHTCVHTCTSCTM